MESKGWHETRHASHPFSQQPTHGSLPPIAVGKVNLCSPDHVSLLIHRTFNASIPRHHLPADNWDFEYGHDPEFGPEAQASEDDSAGVESESAGKWVNRLTGEKLGGTHGQLEFTVIGCVSCFISSLS